MIRAEKKMNLEGLSNSNILIFLKFAVEDVRDCLLEYETKNAITSIIDCERILEELEKRNVAPSNINIAISKGMGNESLF